MRRINSRRAGARAGTTAFLLLVLSLTGLLAAASASAFSDVNTITGTETWPNVTQAGSVVANRTGTSQVLVAYNDGRGALESPANYLGVSVSSNNGETFTRLGQPTPFTGHGTGYGSPILSWDAKRARWIVGQLSSGCGGKGIGLWYSTSGTTWTVGPCAHSGTNDVGPSMWIDNNSASPYYGRIYIGFTEPNEFGGIPKLTISSDSVTWTTSSLSAFGASGSHHLVNVAGSPGASGKIGVMISVDQAVAGGLQEGYGLVSVNGGQAWEGFLPVPPSTRVPGSVNCEGVASVTPNWQHANWGQLAITPKGGALYVYAMKGEGTDEGDIYLGGFKLNTDASGKAQWSPSLRVGGNGTVVATWYDRRNSTNGTNYQRFQRVSYDEGAHWEKEEPLSSTLIPQPTQPNPNLPGCFTGNGNLASAGTGLLGYDTWTDGRVAVEGKQVEKVFFRAMSLKALPGATTEAATFIGSNSATLNGKVNPHGHETTYKFEYGTTTAYGSSTAVGNAGSGVTEVSVSQAVSGLLSKTTYHYRLVATSSEGTTFGADKTVTTS